MSIYKRIVLKGVLIGGIVDLALSSMVGVIHMNYIINSQHLYELYPKEEVIGKYLQILQNDPISMLVSLIIGSTFSILGGYIAAKIAKHDELLNGALTSIFCVLLTIPSFSLFDPVILIFTIILSIVLSCFGGSLRKQEVEEMRKNKKMRPAIQATILNEKIFHLGKIVNKISFISILTGLFFDFIATNFIGGFIAGYLISKYKLQANAYEQLRLLLTTDPIAVTWGRAIGGAVSIMAGYIIARIAKRDEIINTFLASSVWMLFALGSIGTSSLVWVITKILITPVLYCGGGYIRLFEKKIAADRKAPKDD